ncbi:2'-5' RNA ligase family protein [Quadrisphaera sp. RL12-1S]|nr:2'-5' RNA ligase family protein [Quadrisphaera sp. RL12-1S]
MGRQRSPQTSRHPDDASLCSSLARDHERVVLTPSPEAPAPTLTGVVVLVSEADAVVRRHRDHLDGSAAWGVPAHVTVLFPFAAPQDLDDGALTALAGAVASVPAFEAAFTRTAWFGEDVLWLAPEPAGPFVALTRAVASAFPQHQPYGGAFDGSAPHLTVGEARLRGRAALREAERAVLPLLPVSTHVTCAHLLAGTTGPASWRVVRELPLGR